MSIINVGDIPINENLVDGTELARRLERLYAAFHSQNSNSTRPPSVTAGGIWSKTVTDGFEVMLFDGTNDVKIGEVISGVSRLTPWALVTGGINYAGGNVGIGVNNPGSALEIATLSSGESWRVRGRSSDNVSTVRFSSNDGGTIYASQQTSPTYFEISTGSSIPIILKTNSAERIRVNDTGLGIGTNNPAGRVDAMANGYGVFVARSASAGAAVDVIAMKAVDSAAANFANAAYQARSHVWGYNGSTLGMILDNAGKLGIGTGSPTQPLDVNGQIKFTQGLRITPSASDLYSIDGALSYYGTTNGVYLNGTTSGFLGLRGDGTGNSGASIQLNGASYSEPKLIAMFTNGTERMRIDSGGNLLVGAGAVLYGNSKANIYNEKTVSGADACLTLRSAYVTGSGTYVNGLVFQDSGGTVRGYVQWNTSTTAYVTSSDYRLKENIEPMTGALEKVAQLKPVTYDWKNGGSGQGFIAHELQAVVPECVTGEKDATQIEKYEIEPAVSATYDEDGNELTPAIPAVMGEREVPAYQGVDTSFLVATLTAAIQEQQAIIEDLKARVIALEKA